ncbi:hypothetical protein ACLQ28_34085 [Micromonospora sp. DT201]|uniref:hypothetical protein n=1 Tax=Micromonospora sp. DT201 TaxID=3393442 RepID=UPI003CEF4C30
MTNRPVKGALIGSATILAWSFVRTDLPLDGPAAQVALPRAEPGPVTNRGGQRGSSCRPIKVHALPAPAADPRWRTRPTRSTPDAWTATSV